MLGVAGTVPDPDFPLTQGRVERSGNLLLMHDREVLVTRGTPALLAAACVTAQVLGRDAPVAWLAGDEGLGHGSRKIYALFENQLSHVELDVLVFHYLQPDADWHGRVLMAVESMPRRPLLVADAGFQYAAKMCGQAESYDLFTPDAGELAFLADEEAPHPFYTRGFLLQDGNDALELAARAEAHGNAARYLLIKGVSDMLWSKGKVLAQVDGPSVPALEAVGGTGDTLTGMIGALLDSGMDMVAAARAAMRANREAGVLAKADPATSIAQFIDHLGPALELALNQA